MSVKKRPKVVEVAYPAYTQLITPLEYAAIHLRVEHSELPVWLNEMIRKARRDEFAKAAMQGILAAIPDGLVPLPENIAENAFKQAVAMLQESGK